MFFCSIFGAKLSFAKRNIGIFFSFIFEWLRGKITTTNIYHAAFLWIKLKHLCTWNKNAMDNFSWKKGTNVYSITVMRHNQHALDIVLRETNLFGLHAIEFNYIFYCGSLWYGRTKIPQIIAKKPKIYDIASIWKKKCILLFFSFECLSICL